MIFSNTSLFVITYYSHDRTCTYGDEVYTNKATADEVVAEQKDTDLSVMALDDYIELVKEEWKRIGEFAEMDSNRDTPW